MAKSSRKRNAVANVASLGYDCRTVKTKDAEGMSWLHKVGIL